MLKTQIPAMITLRIKKRILTIFSSIFLSKILPIMPPIMPPSAITTKKYHSKEGTDIVAKEQISDATWEIKITHKEFLAAVLVSIEKKKENTTKLIGPPPIPKNEDMIPKIIPMKTKAKTLEML